MKKPKGSSAATKSVSAVARQELTLLDRVLEEISRNYVNRLHREIQMVVSSVERVESRSEFTRRQIKDLKCMLELLRQLQVKPEKGRRKDLKKIDALIGELAVFTENW